MCINAFFAARFQTDLRRQWIAAGLLLFSHKKYRSLYLVSCLSLFLGDASGEWVERLSFSDDALRSIFFPKVFRDTSYMTYVMSFSWKNRSCSVVSAWNSPFHFHYFPTIYILSWSFKLYNEVVFLLNRWSSFNTSNKALPSSFDALPLTVFLLFYFQNR